MPISKELVIHMEDRPGTLAKCCKARADRNVNILAFHSVSEQGKSVVHMVVDNPANAREALKAERLSFNEADVAQVGLPNRPGQLSRAASQLADANINIEHAYSGLDASDSPVVFFGVRDVSKAAAVLDRIEMAA